MTTAEASTKIPAQLSERQTQIVETSIQILAAEGARRFTVQRLASEIGITGGALYRHFDSMEAVLDAVVDRIEEILFEGFPPKNDGPIERLKAFFYLRIKTISSHPNISVLLLSDHLTQAGGEAQAKRLAEFKQRSQAFVKKCFIEAKSKGLMTDKIHPETATLIFLGAILSLAHARMHVGLSCKSEELFDEAWSGILRMLRD